MPDKLLLQLRRVLPDMKVQADWNLDRRQMSPILIWRQQLFRHSRECYENRYKFLRYRYKPKNPWVRP